ncbi:MAG: hypothetical protein P4L99_28605 [Chthoniobacter sp.]|nr:hypothetical protein [Chthoniobacter sp.]
MSIPGAHLTEKYWRIDCGPVLRARLEAAVQRCNQTEPQRREAFTDGVIAREKRRTATFYPAGSLIRVSKLPGFEPYENEKRGKRGKIKGFSFKSRVAFLSYVATLDRQGMAPKFVTLTYPAEYPEQFQQWKEDLNLWAKNHLARMYPNASFIWKLEPQQRGAPHFHLLLFGVPWVDKNWLSQSWYHVVGSDDERHLRAGTRVEDVRSWNGVMAYAGKNYMGKECVAPRNWPEYTGRYWGVYGRKNVPQSEKIEVEMSRQGLARLHRLIRHYFRSRGIQWKTGGGVRLFTTDFPTWLRAAEWAEEHWTHPIDHSAPATRQPF